MSADQDGGALAVYVHWPFCQSKCPYCDFNSHVRDYIDEARFCAATLREIDHFASLTAGREVASLFFGGGTPSLMAPKTVGAVIDRVARSWPLSRDVEITLEANPGSVEAGRFAGYRAAGVNRLSLGVQSFDDDALRFLGRRHDAEQAKAALALAQDVFSRVSFDIIYARPDQTALAWGAELDSALDYATEHLSLYQLTLEPGTPFYDRAARGALTVPDGDTAAALCDVTHERLMRAGMAAYEISNFAKAGAESQHNLNYWRGGDYIGIGPGAHGRLTNGGKTLASRQIRTPERWLATVEDQGHGTAETETIEPPARSDELMMMGLRLTEGVRLDRLSPRGGLAFDELIDDARLKTLIDGGFLEQTETHLRATPSGLRVLDSVLAALLA
ncbi:MAG: radical SAM family heme chaperone HemW [Alphaproteobacteria bacterium]